MSSDTFIKAFLIISLTVFAVSGQCPIDVSGHTLWSTEYSGIASNAAVTISKKILLDVASVTVFSITIEAGGELLFSNNLDISLSAHYIRVRNNGNFIIGTEECKHTAKAYITLLGNRDAYDITGFNEKFIGVEEGGTLEFHGKDKRSWAKLVRTVPKLTYGSGLIFRHTDVVTTSERNVNGLVFHVFNEVTGESIQNQTFRLVFGSQTRVDEQITGIQTFLDAIPDGRIVAYVIQRYIIRQDLTALYDILEDLTGSTVINSVTKYGAYAAITIKGSPEDTVEDASYDTGEVIHSATAELVDLENELKIRAHSIVNSERLGSVRVDFVSSNTDYSMPVIELNGNVSTWQVGDAVMLASTDYDWEQAEECQIIACDDCSDFQVRLDCEPQFTHFGEFCDGIENLDMRGEVGLLTRNIRVRGDTTDSERFGGHIKFLKGFKNVHIEGVELTFMGQNPEIGRYPLHYHMCEDVGPDTYAARSYIRGNSIHHTFARGITIHGTNATWIRSNFIFNTQGHGVFLEDGGESYNIIEWNCVGGQQNAHPLIPADSKAASYWITNPRNYIRHNIGCGGDGFSFWFVYPDEPIGPSFGEGFMQRGEAEHTRIYEFIYNAGHSNRVASLFLDNKVNETNFAFGYNQYEPWLNPFDPDSGADIALLSNFVGYKSRDQIVWIRGGRVILEYCAIADGRDGVTLVRENQQHPEMRKCIIVGDSCNIGEPTEGHSRSLPMPSSPDDPRHGVIMQKGPNYFYDTYFVNFTKTDHYDAAAIAVQERDAGHATALHGVSGLLFGFDDSASAGKRVTLQNPGLPFSEGYVGAFRDYDGSVTGLCNHHVVRDRDFFLTPDCKRRTEWGFAACPNPYGYFEVNNRLGKTLARDDDPSLTDTLINSEGDANFMVILGGEYTYIMEYMTTFPGEFDITAFGVSKDEWFRLGICMPTDSQFELRGFNFPINLGRHFRWTQVNTVAEVDNDATGGSYMFDNETGILFVKFIDKEVRTSDDKNNCINNKCPRIRIKLTNQPVESINCIAKAHENGKYTKNIQRTSAGTYSAVIEKSTDHPPPHWGAKPFEAPPL